MDRSREERLARAFVELADTLVDDFDVIDLMTTLTCHCVDLLDVASSGVMLTDLDGSLVVMGASSELAREFEIRELQSDQGPCLDSYRTGTVQSAPDLDRETRWPRFTGPARDLGFRSVQAVPLRLRRRVIGALNLMDTRPDTLTPVDLRLAQALADMATVGLLSHRQAGLPDPITDQLQAVRTSRVLLEQAVNVVAERRQTDTATAYRALSQRARAEGTTLTVVARAVALGTVDVTDLSLEAAEQDRDLA
ncbi:GAF and ANTAR domain-containing protein [Streptomyces sp. NPDC059819]|uniref:GAF and ANTAR domain-containing protein n=1 Tax=Streptomyces sp. NPDC059819 TaxID=3346963 RepID=UPI00364C342E